MSYLTKYEIVTQYMQLLSTNGSEIARVNADGTIWINKSRLSVEDARLLRNWLFDLGLGDAE